MKSIIASLLVELEWHGGSEGPDVLGDWWTTRRRPSASGPARCPGWPELEEAAERGSTVSVPLGVLRPADSPVWRAWTPRTPVLGRRHSYWPSSRNTGRGLALSLAEREAAGSRIIVSYPHWSNRLIATKTRLSPGTVGAIRSRSTVQNVHLNRVGLDGRTRPLSAVAGRVRASEVISERPSASLRTVATAAGISIGTARDVRERVRRGESPIPPGLSGEGRGASPAELVEESADLAELTALWANLTNDPSLRQSESGRALLRWLSFHAIVPDRLVEAVPPYSAESVRRVALRCAHAWQTLADALAEKSRTTA